MVLYRFSSALLVSLLAGELGRQLGEERNFGCGVFLRINFPAILFLGLFFTFAFLGMV